MSARDQLTCRDFVEVIMAFLDGELDAEQGRLFDAHLAECPDCDHYLDSYKTTVALGKSICDPADADDPVPADVPEELVQAVLAARRQR
jgi:anti-sigma factor RsiW